MRLRAGHVTAHVIEGDAHAKAVTWPAVSRAGDTPGRLAPPNPRMGVSKLMFSWLHMLHCTVVTTLGNLASFPSLPCAYDI